MLCAYNLFAKEQFSIEYSNERRKNVSLGILKLVLVK